MIHICIKSQKNQTSKINNLSEKHDVVAYQYIRHTLWLSSSWNYSITSIMYNNLANSKKRRVTTGSLSTKLTRLTKWTSRYNDDYWQKGKIYLLKNMFSTSGLFVLAAKSAQPKPTLQLIQPLQLLSCIDFEWPKVLYWNVRRAFPFVSWNSVG